MLWHRGNPAGWDRHESLGIRFKSSVAGEIEDLLELLLRTFYSIFSNSVAARPPLNNLASCQASTVLQNPDKMTIYVNTQTDKKQMTIKAFKHHDENKQKQKTTAVTQKLATKTSRFEGDFSNILLVYAHRQTKINYINNFIYKNTTLAILGNKKTGKNGLNNGVIDKQTPKTFKKSYSNPSIVQVKFLPKRIIRDYLVFDDLKSANRYIQSKPQLLLATQTSIRPCHCLL